MVRVLKKERGGINRTYGMDGWEDIEVISTA